MGKYIFNYYSFVNESINQSTAEKIIELAGKYIQIQIGSYKPEEYSAADKLSNLVDILYLQIKNEAGENKANGFVEAAMKVSQEVLTEDFCPICEDLMEPCDACKSRAKEMNRELGD